MISKYIGLATLGCVLIGSAAAQEERRTENPEKSRTVIDTVTMEHVRTGETRRVRISVPGDDNRIISIEKSETIHTTGSPAHRRTEDVDIAVNAVSPKVARPIWGIVFARVDLGLVRLVDNGSFSLAENNRDLRYRPGKTVNFGFDVVQVGYRFSDHFRLFLSGGFDWTHIRLRENIDFLENTTPLQWEQSDIDYSKNRLSSSYLRLPLTFEFRTRHYPGVGRMKFAFGPEGGFLLKGTQKFKSAEHGKQKFKDDYNFTPFRYGAFARVGVGSLGIFAKYYFNDLFENSPDQSGLKQFNIGLMLGF